MNWQMLILGLVLIVVSAFLGFMVGGVLISKALVIPATMTLQMVMPPKKADEIMQLFLNDEHQITGKQTAKMFYTMYRLGCMFWKSRIAKDLYIDALENDSKTQIAYLHYMEQKLGVHFDKEETK